MRGAAGGSDAAARASDLLSFDQMTADARILVVDDEPAVRDLVREVLTREGYRLVLAGSAEEALAAAGGLDRIDLLLTDVSMTGMGGPDLARMLRGSHPGLVSLFMSGSLDDEPADEANGERLRFLAKPFSIDGLVTAVKEALREE